MAQPSIDPWDQFPDKPMQKDARASDPWEAFPDAPTNAIEVEFPKMPGNKPNVIDFSAPIADVRAKIAELPEPQQKKALSDWADAYVSNERKGGGAGQYVSDIVRNLARGTPVGSWLDEANAGLAALQHKAGLGGASYDEAKAYQNATDRAVDKDTVRLGTIPERIPLIGGHEVTGADLTKLAGGALSARAAPMLWQGATLPWRIAGGALSGGAYGLLYGAGEGDTAAERASHAGKAAAVTAGLGAALPVIGAAAGALGAGGVNAYNWATKSGSRQAPIDGYHPNAVQRVADIYERDQLPSVAATKAAELGPEAMIGDLGDASRFAAAGLARTPGGEVATKNIGARQEAAPQRIVQGTDATVGPRTNIFETEQALRKQYGQQADPYYKEFHETPIPYDQTLTSILHAVPESAVNAAKQLMQLERIDPNSIAGTGRMIDYIKRGLSHSAEEAGEHTQVGRAYANLARDLRHATDELLSPGNRAESPWAKARALAGEGIEGREALKLGSKVFTSKRDPDLVAYELADLTGLGKEMYAEGARNDIRQIAGRASSNFGPKGDTATRRALNNEFARENLEQIIGKDRADKLIKMIDAENTMASLDALARQNSITSTMQAVQKTLPQPIDASHAASHLPRSTITGFVAGVANKVLSAATAGKWNDRQALIAKDMAEMLTAQGAQRDAIIGALEAYISRHLGGVANASAVRAAVREIVDGIGAASRPFAGADRP